MKFRDYIFVAIIIIGIIMLFQWRMSNLEDKLTIQENKYTNAFQQLSDSLSAKSATQVILPPTKWQEFFNTGANKEFQDFLNKNLGPTLKREIDKIKFPPGSVLTINKTSILIEGDSAYFRNEDGIVTKIAKVMPVNGDSSLLVIVPQDIDITLAEVKVDPKNPDSLIFFASAFNRTTGDSLKITNSISYVIPKKDKKWNFGLNPFIGTDYSLSDKELIIKGGFTPIIYKGKKFNAQLLGVQLEYGLQNHSDIRLQLLNLQFKKK
jgi:hypothetical protein